MFKKATKHISRAGTTPVKVLFNIEVKTVALKSLKDLTDGRYFVQQLSSVSTLHHLLSPSSLTIPSTPSALPPPGSPRHGCRGTASLYHVGRVSL